MIFKLIVSIKSEIKQNIKDITKNTKEEILFKMSCNYFIDVCH